MATATRQDGGDQPQTMGRARLAAVTFCMGIALAAGLALWLLGAGRPLYYSDGSLATRADELAEAPMLVWQRANAETELPGPVVGRVQPLPDGRLLYGLGIDAGRTDLVVFDPELPELAPVPLRTLNAPRHDFAPALGADGSLWFASDRRGGVGGFDLWRAAPLGGGRFGAPEAVGGGVNTPADETDPAPAADGRQLVYVRRLRGDNEGRNGRLWWHDLTGRDAARPVFPKPQNLRQERLGRWSPSIDRDPGFAPDGAALWFVREQAGRPAELMVSHRHRDAFSVPAPVSSIAAGRVLRGPVLAADGFSMRLVQPGDQPLLCRAEARALYPWWAGQLPLERLLQVVSAVALLLGLLLLLGARWKQLDVVTWCLLISLVLHLLVYLWLQGLEIMRPEELPGRGGDRLALRVVAAGSAAGDRVGTASTADGSTRSAAARVRARVRRELSPDEVNVSRPVSAMPDLAVATPPRAAPRSAPADRRGARGAPPGSERPSAAAQIEWGDAPARVSPRSASDPVVVDWATGAGPASEVARAAAASAPAPVRVAVAPDGEDVALVERPVATRLAAASERGAAADLPSRRPAADLRRVVASGPGSVDPGASPDLMDAVAEVSVPSPQPDAELLAVVAERLAAATPTGSRTAASPAAPQRPTAAEQDGTGSVVVERPASALAAAARSEALPPPRRPVTGVLSQFGPRGLQDSTPAPQLDDAPSLVVAAAEASLGREAAAAAPPLATADLARLGAPASRPGNSAAGPERSVPAGSSVEPGDLARPAPQLMSSTARGLPARRRRSDPLTASIRPARAVQVDSGPELGIGIDAGDTVSAGAPDRRPDAGVDLVALSEPMPVVGSQDGHRARVEQASRLRGSLPRSGSVWPGLQPPATGLVAAPAGPTPDPRRQGRAPEQLPGLFANRYGPRKAEALERFGGTAATEAAVARGLAYLASHQDEAGRWIGRRDLDQKYGATWIGRSSLCVLAFLGAGHTHESETSYSGTVERALAALSAEQDPVSGHFGRSSSYSHGITTYAMAECLAMTGDERLRAPLEKAVAWILRNQDQSRDPRSRGGWGYFSSTLRPEDGYARTSVTGWMVMALESARLSDLEVPESALAAARQFLLRKFDARRGYFLYSEQPSRLRSSWRTLPASTPIATFCLTLLGERVDGPRLREALDFTVERRPRRWRKSSDDGFVLRGEGNPYFWYAGTLACFLAGGETWQTWNDALKDVALDAQRRDGSFPPVGAYAAYAGDSADDACFTTALAVLSLEVYYRYFTPLLDGR